MHAYRRIKNCMFLRQRPRMQPKREQFSRETPTRRRPKHLKLLKKALHQEAAEGRSLVTPFHSFEFDLTPAECQLNSVQWTKRVDECVSYLAGYEPGGQKLAGSRLRIGYFSGSGFHNSTTTARSMRSQYGMHTRMYVEVYCYAGQPDDGSEVRSVIKRGCDKFVEVAGLGFHEVANLIKTDNVKVLIDPTGYIHPQHADRGHVHRPCAGAGLISRVSEDDGGGVHPLHSLTNPPEYADFYTEKFMVVPHTYLTNDHRQSRREVLQTKDAPTSSEFGVGDYDLILCSFNQLYKIEPQVFGVWMSSLKRLPKAKLWHLEFTKDGVSKLRKAAEKQGVDSSRIVAHEQFPTSREFRIKGLADLFLDTPLFNSHTRRAHTHAARGGV
mmetsp:Transcript_31372/g.76881  ORF Transcript_31372/g.76881 Transcript_31372/m.76881 type:complete len:384 (+) Transcript_31372:203-1354(+)